MKLYFIAAATFLIGTAAIAKGPANMTQVCWLEISAGNMDAALGGDGMKDTKVWNSTVSSVLIRHSKGDVLVDTGFGPHVEAQMNELPDAERAFGMQILAGAKDRKSILDLLPTVGEQPDRISRIIVTHAHYDHIGGATNMSAPVYVSAAEENWMASQSVHPTIVPPSLIAALKPRLKTVTYDSGPYLGFNQSQDVYGDGAIIVVPLPGHTPGQQGVFLKLGERRVFLIGDVADTLEAAERGLAKSAPIRTATDFEPELADVETKRISDFHRSHPDIAIVPAHDRVAYLAIFSGPSTCVSRFPLAQDNHYAN